MARHFFTPQLIIVALGICMAASWGLQNAQGQTDYDFVNPNNDTVANWHDSTYWDPSGIPSAAGDTATFTRPTVSPSAGFTIQLFADATVGALTIDSSSYTDPHNFTIEGFGTLTFQTTSGSASYTETAGGSGNERITVNLPISVLSDTVMTFDHRSELNTSSIFAQPITGSSDRTITKEGLANVQLDAEGLPGFEGQYIINNGALRFIGTSDFTDSAGITVNSGGQLQINSNNLAPTNDWSLADGAVLTLNGPGKAPGVGLAAPGGALRFQGQAGHNPRHIVFQSEVVFESDVTIAAGPAQVTGELFNVVSGPGGLLKNAPGSIIISNPASSYDGDTTVDEGMLSFTNPILADGADVYLASSVATLNLNYTGTDVIDSFFIDDVAQAVGLWGATGNGLAEFTTDWITGDGLLDVQSLGSLTGDYNEDGVVDAADYALWRSDPASYGGDPDGYDDWVANFGSTSGSSPSAVGSSAVPEPCTGLLALFALGGLLAIAIKR